MISEKEKIWSITYSLRIYKGLYSDWEEDNSPQVLYGKRFLLSRKRCCFREHPFPEIPGEAQVCLSSECEEKLVCHPRYLVVISMTITVSEEEASDFYKCYI